MSDLRNKQNRIQGQVEIAYEDRLEGRISAETYDKKVKELKDKQIELVQQMERHEKADKNYYINAGRLLELASRAHELFRGSKLEQKRRLLEFFVLNLRLNGKELKITYQKPFDMIFEHASRSDWYPQPDLNRCYRRERAVS